MTAIPAVSVIVPCHNDGRFLDGLLASLRAQTRRDYEVIIVDDGSDENATLGKLRELEPTVRIVRQEQRYLPGARNTGFREARADFVVPLDCDDRLEPEFLAEALGAIGDAENNVGFVFTDMRLSGALTNIFTTHCNRFDQLFLNHMPYCMLLRKSAWQAVGGYDETMRQGLEDWEFNIRLLRSGYQWIKISKPLFIYNIRPDGMLLSSSARRQATTWNSIRRKHADLYRPGALIAIRQQSQPGWRSTLRACILFTLAKTLPESWCNALFFKMNMATRRLRMAWRSAKGGAQFVPQ